MNFKHVFSILLSVLVASVCSSKEYHRTEDFEAIRQLTNSYALAVDSKNSSALANSFTPNAVFSLSAPPVSANGSTAIAAFILGTEGNKTSQHAVSTQTIRFTGKGTASAVTYFTATFFGQGDLAGQIAQSFGKYEDELSATPLGWRIQKKKLVFFVSFVTGTSPATLDL